MAVPGLDEDELWAHSYVLQRHPADLDSIADSNHEWHRAFLTGDPACCVYVMAYIAMYSGLVLLLAVLQPAQCERRAMFVVSAVWLPTCSVKRTPIHTR